MRRLPAPSRPAWAIACLGLAGCADLLGLDFHALGEGARCGADLPGWACADGLRCDDAADVCVPIDQPGGAGGGGAGGQAGQGGGGAGGALVCSPGEEVPCAYPGPDGTLGVGACKAGADVCKADGSGWDACVGEVVPAPESPLTKPDDDCDGHPSGDLLAQQLFGDEQNQGLDRVEEGGGEVWIQGSYTGSLELGGAPGPGYWVGHVGPGGVDLILTLTTAQAFQAQIQALGVDRTGAAVVAGYASAPTTFAGLPVDGHFVVAVSKTGQPKWLTTCSAGAGSASFAAVAGDPSSDAVVLTGTFDDAFSCGGAGAVSAGGWDAFALRLGPTGAEVWTHAFGDAGDQGAWDVAVGPSGDLVLALHATSGALDLGGGPLAGAVLAKLAPSGLPAWGVSYGAGAILESIAVHPDETITLAASNGDFGGGPIPYGLGLVHLDAAGAHVWSKALGGGYPAGTSALALGQEGAIALAAGVEQGTDFGGGPFAAGGAVGRFAPDGTFLWSRGWSVPLGMIETSFAVKGVAVSPDAVILGGTVMGTFDPGGGPLASEPGSPDVWTLKLEP